MRFEVISPSDSIVLREENWGWATLGFRLYSYQGWSGTPAPRDETVSRVNMAGAYMPAQFNQGTRVLTLECGWAGRSTLEVEETVDRVNALMGVPLTVNRIASSGKRAVTGFLSDDPQTQVTRDDQTVRFTLTITCPDPYKYGDPVAYMMSGNSVYVENEGNAPTWPVVVVENPNGVGFVNVSDGQGHDVNWQDPDATATSVELDFRKLMPPTGTVTSDNAFPIPPKGMDVYATATLNSTMWVEARPAWL